MTDTIELTEEDRATLRDASAIVDGTVSFPMKRLWEIADGLRNLAWRGDARAERAERLPDLVGVEGREVVTQERIL